LFIYFPSLFSLSSQNPEGEEMTIRTTDSLNVSEEFAEKFSEILFRDD
jgi:hypothetical protein